MEALGKLWKTVSRKIHERLRMSVILFCCMNNIFIKKGSGEEEEEERSQSNKRKLSTEEQVNKFQKITSSEKMEKVNPGGTQSASDMPGETIGISDASTKSALPTSDIQHNQNAQEKIITEIGRYKKRSKKYMRELNTNDKTNFAAAELGFSIEVQTVRDKKRIERFHFPVKIPNKNTFNIYDIGKEKVDEFIKCVDNKNAIAKDDYHSETALFIQCLETSFQEEMIKKLIKDLSNIKNLKHVTLQNLILQIHSKRDMCKHCYKKAKYLFNWKDEQKSKTKEKNTEEEQGKQDEHFLKPFEETFLNLLKECNIPVQKLDRELEVFIIFSHDEICKEPATESNRCFIRLEKVPKLIDYAILSQYSIFTSGGSDTHHKNYPGIYDKAVELARMDAVK